MRGGRKVGILPYPLLSYMARSPRQNRRERWESDYEEHCSPYFMVCTSVFDETNNHKYPKAAVFLCWNGILKDSTWTMH